MTEARLPGKRRSSAGASRRPMAWRRALFWIHLGCGVTAGLVILMMSVTGVLLTYERQIVAAAERGEGVAVPPGAQRLPFERLLALAAAEDFQPTSINVSADPAAPVVVAAGRRDSRRLDPYSGAPVAEGAAGLREFFGTVTAVHRWFAAGDANRDLARQITGASNLLFLLLAVSGLVLWWPQLRSWAWVRARLWFRPRYASAKARDYNWHHVLGFWCAIPLVVITATAAVFSYGWANDLLYRLAGEAPPEGGRGGPQATARTATPASRLDLDVLFDRAVDRAGTWREASITLPASAGEPLSIRFDAGNGGQPQYTRTLQVDPASGAIVAEEPFAARSAGARARSIVRFLHTGEVLGLVGQTLAGLASLAGAVLVWTGLALAYRRLLRPLLMRRSLRASGRVTATRS